MSWGLQRFSQSSSYPSKVPPYLIWGYFDQCGTLRRHLVCPSLGHGTLRWISYMYELEYVQFVAFGSPWPWRRPFESLTAPLGLWASGLLGIAFRLLKFQEQLSSKVAGEAQKPRPAWYVFWRHFLAPSWLPTRCSIYIYM